MSAIRIAMVSEHASPLAVLGGEDAGGQNVHVAALATALSRMGVEVTVHTRRDDASLPDQVELAPGVTVDHVDAGPPTVVPKDEMWPYMDQFAGELRRRWQHSRPDVVHSHFWMSGYAALDAAEALDIPVAHTFHALGTVKRRHAGATDPSPAERLSVERQIATEADRIIATCSDEVFELARMGGDLSKVNVVPCGVDLSLFHPNGPSMPRSSDLSRIVFVGRLVERKGIGNVIEALARIPNAELLIAGGPAADELASDKEVARLRAVAKQHHVEDRVVFMGRVERDDLPALLRSADAVTCVPWYEPFGIVPLEAMACGAPLIAAATGGLIDTVVDGVTGIHVEPRRPDQIVEAARTLLGDADLRKQLGVNGAARARELYGWDRIARSTLSVYRSMAVVLDERVMEKAR